MIKDYVRKTGLAVLGAALVACAPIEPGTGQDPNRSCCRCVAAGDRRLHRRPGLDQGGPRRSADDQGGGRRSRAPSRRSGLRGRPDRLGRDDHRGPRHRFPGFRRGGQSRRPLVRPRGLSGPAGGAAQQDPRMPRAAATLACSPHAPSGPVLHPLGHRNHTGGANHPEHVNYLRDQLARSDAIWSICAWHKNQSAMQVGEQGRRSRMATLRGLSGRRRDRGHGPRAQLLAHAPAGRLRGPKRRFDLGHPRDRRRGELRLRLGPGRAQHPGPGAGTAPGGPRSTPAIRAPTSAPCSASSSPMASPIARPAISRTSTATFPTASS